jgi:hypothetical protein
MAILNMYSFDNVSSATDLAGWWSSGGAAVNTTTKRTGPQSMYIGFQGAAQGPGSLAFKHTASNTRWLQTALAVRTVNINPGTPIGVDYLSYAHRGIGGFFEGNGLTTPHIFVGFNLTTLQLEAWRYPDTLLAQSIQGNLLTDLGFVFATIYVVIDDTVGRVVVTLNGVTHIDFTGDTRNGGTGVIDVVSVSNVDGGAYYDDLILGDGSGSMNTTPPGDSRVEYIVPNGDGAVTGFTPSTGSNWQTVDETGGPNDGDYNTGQEMGLTDLFAMTDLSGTGIIHGIQTTIRARKDDAGLKTVVPLLYKAVDSGGTARRYEGPEIYLGDSFVTTQTLYEHSPDTGVAWTADEINALQMGYRVGGSKQFSLDAVVGS